MKKLSLFAVITALALVMTACGRDMNYIIQHEPSISGVVAEVYSNAVLMTAEDVEYVVSLNVENSDSATTLSVGDEIIVYYDGMIAESYPMQINKVYAILLIDPVSREE